MIKPTPGRVVYFLPALEQRDPNGQPLAATVAKVIDDRVVNLTVHAADGTTYPLQHVTLLQDGDELPDPNQAYAFWMPYQKGQAAKTEAAIAAGPTGEQIAGIVATAVQNFGESLDPIFVQIGQRLAALEQRPPAPPAAPPPPIEAGGATQQSQ